MKAKYLLGEQALQRGCKEVPLSLLQEAIGCAQMRLLTVSERWIGRSEDLPRLDCGAVPGGPSCSSETEIISIMKLLAFIVLACHRGSSWEARWCYVTDNSNVRSWLFKRRPKNRIASLLVRWLETEHNFRGTPTTDRYYTTVRSVVIPKPEGTTALIRIWQPAAASPALRVC